MKRLLVAAALTACLGLAAPVQADMAEANALYAAGQHEEAFAAYAELARDQDGAAMLRMAQMFEAGEGVAASRTRALTWYRRAAAHDVAEAHFRIGQMYETGIGVPRDYAAAVHAYRAGADLGHVASLVALANLYADGSGAMPDTSEAARLLKQAADSGDAQALAALDRLVAGGTVPRDVLDALGIPPPAPPVLPTVEELTAEGLAAQDAGAETAAAGSGDTVAAQTATIGESPAAAKVRAAIESGLATFSSGEETSLDYRLDIVESDDGAMLATIRALRMVSSDAIWDIGDIVYAFTPVDGSTYDVVLTAPAETAIFDGDGMAAGGTTMASHEITGTWNIALNLWTRSFADIHDLVLTMAPTGKDAIETRIARITGNGAMENEADGKWSGTNRVTIDDVSFSVSSGETGGVGRINLVMDQRAVDYVFFQAMGLARSEFDERFGPEPDVDDPAVQSALQDLTRPLFDMARERAPLIGDVAFDIELLDMSGKDADDGEPYAVERIHLAMGARDMDAATGVIELVYEHSGFVAAIEGAGQRYLPGEAAFVVALRELPIEDAATMALEMFEGGLDDPAAFEDNAMMALTFLALGLQQSMATSASTLDIERIAYTSEALKASMTGALVANMESPLGATGTVTMEIEGLDAAVAELSAQSEDPDAQEMVMPLVMLQAMGERIEEAGIVRHVYVVELTPDGRTLLNGNDMGPMMDGMMGGGEESTY